MIEARLEVFDWLHGRRDGRVARSPAGYLVKSITDGYATPKGFVSGADRRRLEEERRAEERAAAQALRREREQKAREQAEQRAIAAYWESLTPEQQAELDAASIAAADPGILEQERGPLKRTMQRIRRDQYIRRLLKGREAGPAEG